MKQILPPVKLKSTSRKAVRFPGVAADAKRLGVSKAHLWNVLAGQRISHRLSRRYRELKDSKP